MTEEEKQKKEEKKEKKKAAKAKAKLDEKERRANTAGKPERAFHYSKYFGLFALAILILYAFGESNGEGWKKIQQFFDLLGIVLSLAFCSFAVGGIIGFLFGIPHSAQPAGQGAGAGSAGHQNGTSAPSAEGNPPPRYDYAPSTNLEQIADWLTKIMVGVGLTQIPKIIARFNELCNALGKALAPHLTNVEQAAPIAGVILILFSIVGFLIVYLWTYLYLIGIQRNMICGILDMIRGQIRNTDINDKKAYDLANLQLNKQKEEADIPVNELVDAFKKTSGSKISEIFFLAVEHRKRNLPPDQRFHVDKIIPVLQALTKLDPASLHAENYAELGYVMMHKETPDFAAALNNFDIAVKGYKEDNQAIDKSMLYMCRAYCKIRAEGDKVKAGQASAPADKASIQADLSAAKTGAGGAKTFMFPDEDKTISAWQTLNP